MGTVFKSLSLKSKLLLYSGALSMFLVVTGVASFLTFKTVSSKYQYISTQILPKTKALGEMRGAFKDVNAVTSLLATWDGSSDELVKKYQDSVDSYKQAETRYLNSSLTSEEQEKFKNANIAMTSFLEASQKLVNEAKSASKKEDLKTLLGAVSLLATKYLAEINELIDFQTKTASVWMEEAASYENYGRFLMGGLYGVGIVFSMLIGFWFSKNLSSLLLSIVEKITAGATEVASASKQIASSSEELSAGATQQAASLEQTAASIEQMSAMTIKNSENATRSKEVAATSLESAGKGREVVGEMISSINEISESNNNIKRQVEDSNRQISEIVKVIAEIGNKTKVINDIVFQTKLLSFNASVEAARAGEHGKGFAVVAEEVGKLAQMSGNAAKEISEMLENSIKKVETIVSETKTKVQLLIEEGKSKVESGTTIAQRCGDVLARLVTDVDDVSRMAGEIANASHEQSQGIKEITKATGQLEQVTQQNASASSQTASAADQLAKQAVQLNYALKDLLVAVNGEKVEQRKAVATPEQPKPSNVINLEEVKAKSQLSGVESSIAKNGDNSPAFDDPRFTEK